MARMRGMNIAGGNKRRVQARQPRKDGFTEAKRQIVLDHLAGCSNLVQAAAAAAVSVETVNYHRRRDPAFAQQCAEAIDVGYAALDAMVLAEAAGGGRYVPGETRVGMPATLNADLALHLLQLRQRPVGARTGRGGPRPKRVTEAELNDSILAKLDVLDRRLKLKRHEVRKLRSRKAVAARAARPDAAPREGA